MKISSLLSSATESQISRLSELPQSLILHGRPGVGLRTIALELAGSDLHEIIEPTDKDGHVDRLRGSIGIEVVRHLQQSTRTKTGRRVVIIDDADMMTKDAQNAFLKLLEEPNTSTKFILTSHRLSQLLPTVISRTQIINATPISDDSSDKLIEQLSDEPRKRAQLKFIAGGLPAEIYRLTNDEKLFLARAEQTSRARDFLAMKAYDKLKTIVNLSKSRDDSLVFLASLELLLYRQCLNAPNQQILEFLKTTSTVYDNILGNFNLKAQLLRLVV